MKELFHKLSAKVSNATGSPLAFVLAFTVVVIWALSGPSFGYSETWQLFINTGTTIVTFLMVFLVQNTQNRDSKALHLKLDELIRSNKSANNNFLNLENLTDEELALLDNEFRSLRERQGTSKSMQAMHARIAAAKAERESKRTFGSTLTQPLATIGSSILNAVRKAEDNDKPASKK